MALKVKPIDKSTTKWTENASRAATEYGENAIAAASDWQTKTVAAKDNYGMAIASAGIKDRFARGASKAGAAKYSRMIESKGKDRFGPGVAAGSEDYKTGAEPFFSTLASLTLSPAKPRGDPANINRVSEVNKALFAKRMALLGGGGA